MLKRILSSFFLAAMLIGALAGCSGPRFDQTTSKNDLLTEKYSLEQVETLKRDAEAGHRTFSKFKQEFAVQCARKTDQGYYVVLLLEDGENAYAFFNSENLLVRVLITSGFQTKSQFQSQVAEQMPMSEVLHLDQNSILLPVSAVSSTAHLVREGVFLINYTRIREGEILADPIVASIKFLDNESLAASEDPLIQSEIPYLLPMDKGNS